MFRVEWDGPDGLSNAMLSQIEDFWYDSKCPIADPIPRFPPPSTQPSTHPTHSHLPRVLCSNRAPPAVALGHSQMCQQPFALLHMISCVPYNACGITSPPGRAPLDCGIHACAPPAYDSAVEPIQLRSDSARLAFPPFVGPAELSYLALLSAPPSHYPRPCVPQLYAVCSAASSWGPTSTSSTTSSARSS